MTMVERVARAIGAICDDADWHRCRAAARAAIEAVREPTPHMLKTTDDAENRVCCAAAYERLGFDETWPMMIDAALAEK
jgi:hypothetical protein